MTPTPRFALPPLSTKLRTVMEAHIDRLSELRWADIANKTIDEDSPADLRALASFVKEFAKTSDDVLTTVATDAVLTGTGYLRIVHDATEGDLVFALSERAQEIEAGRAEERLEAERRGHGALTAKNWGYRDE